MNFDFALILVLATSACGIIWAFDAIVFAPKRRLSTDTPSVPAEVTTGEDTNKEPAIVEYARSFFPVLLAVLLLRSFLVEPFRIPSGSMIPTLHIGDFILVNKYAYGLRWPVLNTKFLEIDEPKRGDVVVFRFPRDPSVDYIKRVIGQPGDKVRYSRKRLTINGQLVPLRLFDDAKSGEKNTVNHDYAQLRETLNGTEHSIQVSRRYEPNHYNCLQGGEYTVPAGHYFVMGDNRDNSNDSRFWCAVPEENLVGKAFFIWMNWNEGIEWGRIGTTIQ